MVCVCAFVRHYVLLHLGRVREDQAERTLRMYGREQEEERGNNAIG